MPRIRFVDGEPEICVKDHVVWANHNADTATAIEQLSQSTVEALYVDTQQAFWDRANNISHTYGYGDVSAEGRSGGWLAVQYPPPDFELAEELDWDADLDVAKFKEFANEIAKLQRAAEQEFERNLKDYAANENHLTRGEN